MKKKRILDRIKLGVFMLLGIVLLTVLIFYIGSNQQMFGTKRKLIANFKNVGGLKEGNAVRYSGVEIGAVESIQIISDSNIRVTMAVDKSSSEFIKKDSQASISNEGLLGTKYVKISPGTPEELSLGSGEEISTTEPLDLDRLLAELNQTGTNAKHITQNINTMTERINNGEGTLGTLLTNKQLLNQVQEMVLAFEQTGKKTKRASENMIQLTDSLKIASGNAITASSNIVSFSEKLDNDSSVLGKFIGDTVMAQNVDKTMDKINTVADDVGLTSCRVRNSWIIRLFGRN
jgi:phospholipid/cholesterol/gamma-HCH transport system substrate-binding protein